MASTPIKKGSLVAFYVMEGQRIPVRLDFDGDGELRAIIKFVYGSQFWTFDEPNHSLISTNPARENKTPVCPDHGGGRHIKANKGHGSHKFYCAYKLDSGGYCGKKIN